MKTLSDIMKMRNLLTNTISSKSLMIFSVGNDTSMNSFANKKTDDLSVIHERESEYYGSNITNQHDFGFGRGNKFKSIPRQDSK
jgi:hypothetical protein